MAKATVDVTYRLHDDSGRVTDKTACDDANTKVMDALAATFQGKHIDHGAYAAGIADRMYEFNTKENARAFAHAALDHNLVEQINCWHVR